jgi:hypothetical protein
MRKWLMVFRQFLSLRKPPLRDAACGGSSGQGGCLEGRTTLVQSIVNFSTRSKGRIARLGVACALLLAPTVVMAQPSAARQACGADLKQLCGEVKPGEGRLKACVKEHFGQLSAPCQTALLSNVTITKSCKTDAQQKCAGIEPAGGRIQACMKDHFMELTEPCKEALLLAKLQQQ